MRCLSDEFPAPAGMNRLISILRALIAGVPRPRGDEPEWAVIGLIGKESSPPPRG